MEHQLPPALAAEMASARGASSGRGGRVVAVAGDRRHALVALDRAGFTIRADGRPPLRGYVDILEGERRIDRRLVICCWAADGLVGYEFKRDEAAIAAVPVDHVAPAHAGLLGPAD